MNQLSLFEYNNKNSDGYESIRFSLDEIVELYRNVTVDYYMNRTTITTHNNDLPASILITALMKEEKQRSAKL